MHFISNTREGHTIVITCAKGWIWIIGPLIKVSVAKVKKTRRFTKQIFINSLYLLRKPVDVYFPMSHILCMFHVLDHADLDKSLDPTCFLGEGILQSKDSRIIQMWIIFRMTHIPDPLNLYGHCLLKKSYLLPCFYTYCPGLLENSIYLVHILDDSCLKIISSNFWILFFNVPRKSIYLWVF